MPKLKYKPKYIHISEVAERAKQSFLDTLSGKIGPCAMPRCWDKLSTIVDGGWWPGVSFLVGSTGTGKSQFAIQAAIAAAQRNSVVLYITTELDDEQVYKRAIGQDLELPWSSIMRARDKRLQDIINREQRIDKLPVFIEYIEALSGANAFVEETKALREAYPKKRVFIIVDYLQALGRAESTENLRIAVKTTCYEAVKAAKECRASILLISSVAREYYHLLAPTIKKKGTLLPGEGDPSRMIGLGKESGDIEYSADNVFTLCQGSYEDQSWLAVAKQRMGPSAWIEFQYDKSLGLFKDVGVPKAEVTKEALLAVLKDNKEYNIKDLRITWGMQLGETRLWKDKLLETGYFKTTSKANVWLFIKEP